MDKYGEGAPETHLPGDETKSETLPRCAETTGHSVSCSQAGCSPGACLLSLDARQE
jgi:hypothetical protein